MAKVKILLLALMLFSQFSLQAQFREIKNTTATNIKSADLYGKFVASDFGNCRDLYIVFAKEHRKQLKGVVSPQLAADRLSSDIIKQELYAGGDYAFSVTPRFYLDGRERFFSGAGGHVITGLASILGICSPDRFVKPLHWGASNTVRMAPLR